jgi:hypothetical protein
MKQETAELVSASHQHKTILNILIEESHYSGEQQVQTQVQSKQVQNKQVQSKL